MKAAVEINNKNSATMDEIVEAITNLQDAMDGLKINKEKLTSAIIKVYEYLGAEAELDEETSKIVVTEEEEAKMLKANQFVHYSEFEQAFSDAIELHNDVNNPSVDEIYGVVFNLNYHLNALKLDKSKLQEAYNKAVTVNTSYYEPEGVFELKQAIANAKVYLEKVSHANELYADANQIAAATERLNNACDNLTINKQELAD